LCQQSLSHGRIRDAYVMEMFWVFAGVLSLVTVAGLLASGAAKTALPANRSEGALAIYKDQLTELERDVASGTLGADEAEAQRTEISRRLLAAAREQERAPSNARGMSKFAVLAVPLLAGLIYWQIGQRAMPDSPRADRLAKAEEILAALKDNPNADATGLDWDATLAVVEDQQAKTPDNVQGWAFLATSYRNLGRYGDAATAMAEVIRISGPSAELYGDLGEALVFDNKGLMTDRSSAVIAEALKLDPKHPKARYYAALDLLQEGKTADAKAAFEGLLADAPANAPWRAAVQGQLAKLQPSATAPQLSAEQMQNGAAMSAEDRAAMIRTMVDGLDEKLKSNPQDIEGWLRLIRARTVLNDTDKAQAALATARTTFATNDSNKKLLDDLATELKLK
jgi:cytochrome c-type biogenesis protein CcmH